jgi:hypothetical protein
MGKCLEQNKIICASWIGRFGNRCHSYLYGKHIEDKFGFKFYVPSKWEGSVLFKNPAPVVSSEFSKLGFIYSGGSINTDSFVRNKEKLVDYNKKYGDSIELEDPVVKNNYGKKNIAYISLVTDGDWFFRKVKLSELRRYFEFSDEVRDSEVYRELESKKGTYDIAHFRRTDISRKNYVGGHSMVSKQSYYNAFDKFGVDKDTVEWVSDERTVGWNWEGEIPNIGGQRISWLPDFLKLVFARKIFRSNSSFSVWAGWLSDAEVYAPWLHEYSPGKEVDFEFVKGNHPHWMSVKGVHANYEFGIIDDLRDSYLKKEKTKMEISSKPRPVPVTKKTERDVIMLVHWNGRFGNRVGSYVFGRNYAEMHDLDFYLPSEWEGTHLFVDTKYKVIDNDELRLKVNQTKQPFDTLNYRSTAVAEYCEQTGKKLTYMNPDNINHYGKTNVFYDSLCVGGDHIFKDMSRKKILEWLEFTDEVKNLDVYKRLEDRQGTYDIAHLRRDDISNANYNKNNHQGYSVITKDSYLRTFAKFGYDPTNVEWTTDDWTGKWGVGKPQHRSGGWNYPVGTERIPDVMFDWLPDFLRLYFARTIFRANSSFSWWAAFLSPCAKTYSPILTQRKIYYKDSDEVNFEFVEGNHPHWLHVKGGVPADEIVIV